MTRYWNLGAVVLIVGAFLLALVLLLTVGSEREAVTMAPGPIGQPATIAPGSPAHVLPLIERPSETV